MSKNIISKMIKVLLAIITCGIIGLVSYEYWMTTHRINFKINDKYKAILLADECGSCFLDWQIDFIIRIIDLKNNKKYRHKFWMANGPYIQFGTPKNGENKLAIQGYNHNGVMTWLIDFDKNTIEEMGVINEMVKVRETYNFQLFSV